MEQDNQVEPTGASAKNEIWEWVKALVIAAVLVFLIRWLVFAPFIVDGPSMEPNFYTGERLIVSKIVYKFREPKRGEVVVFHAPAGRDYIKRVIGLPGETVKLANNKVYINGEELKEPYLVEAVQRALENGESYNREFPETKVADGSVFVLGDNRLNSQDSRAASVGSVPFEKIVGRADVIFWPLDKFSFVQHN